MSDLSNEPTPLSDLQQELTQLRERVSALEARDARRRRWILGLVAASFVMAPLAIAANGNCPNGLPNCFVANNPALAAQVNHNFAQLKEWLELKVGTVATNVTISTPTTINSTLDVPGAVANGGNITASGALSARSMTIATTANVNGAFSAIGASSIGSTLTVAGATTLNSTLNVSGATTVNGNFSAPNNQHEGCYDTAYECGWLQCANGYYMVGLDIAENENCGGSGDFDFSPFALRCCRL